MPVPINRKFVEPFSQLELIAKQVVEGFITGLHKSPFHGFSVEFAEHRLYNQGEATNHIDWKLFGRTDKLFVKRYEEETNLRCQVVIDASSSMYFPFNKQHENNPTSNKLYFSVYAAAAVMELLKKQRDAVGLTVYTDKIDVHTPAHSTTRHHRLLYHEMEKLLEPIAPDSNKRTSAREVMHQIAESVHRRSLVIIFSDMFESDPDKEDELFAALQHLKHNKHEVILFHVVDKAKEVDFDFDSRPYRFIDLESGEELKINPKEVRENYVRSMDELTKNLSLRCAQYKIDFVEADINLGFEQVLLPYFMKRQKL